MATPTPTHTLDTPHFALLDRLVRRMADRGHADTLTRFVVDVLTSTADPHRADRLATRATEAPAMVERLAVWALQRVDAATVARASALLDDRVGSDDVTLVA